MAHEIETMAYNNEKPWHGLGFKVEGKTSVEGMLKAAKLDWEVKLEKLYAHIEGHKPIEVEDQFALVRSSDQKVLDIAGKAYRPIQNEAAFAFFKEYVEAGGATMETMGSLRGGKFVWGLAKLNSDFKLKGNDKVEGYLLVMAPHQVGKAFVVKHTLVRVVCMNTLTLALSAKGTEFRMAHRAEFNESMIETAKETLGIARDQTQDFKKTAEKLQKLKLTRYEAAELLIPIYQPNLELADLKKNMDKEFNPKLARIMDIYEKAPGAQPGNGWGALNAVTFFADHVASRTPDKRLTNAWIGKTANQKQRVLDALLALA